MRLLRKFADALHPFPAIGTKLFRFCFKLLQHKSFDKGDIEGVAAVLFIEEVAFDRSPCGFVDVDPVDEPDALVVGFHGLCLQRGLDRPAIAVPRRQAVPSLHLFCVVVSPFRAKPPPLSGGMASDIPPDRGGGRKPAPRRRAGLSSGVARKVGVFSGPLAD
ncbi:hypothetical protein ACVJBD_006090 [Rhizobium mongolense]